MNHHSRGQHGEYSIKFHSMRFLYLGRTTWDFGDGNFSEPSLCLCQEKSAPTHAAASKEVRFCNTGISLSVSVCAVSLYTKILQRAENDEKFSLPLQQLPWDFTVLGEMTWIRVERGKRDFLEENALCPSRKTESSRSSCQNGWDDVRIFVSLQF